MSNKKTEMTVAKSNGTPKTKRETVTVTKSFGDIKGMIDTTEEILSNFIDPKTGYWLGRTYKNLKTVEKKLNEKIDALLKRYGTEEEVGKGFKIDPKAMPANYKLYETAFMDLMKEETEIDVYTDDVNDVVERNPDFRFRGSWFVILEDVFTGDLRDDVITSLQ